MAEHFDRYDTSGSEWERDRERGRDRDRDRDRQHGEGRYENTNRGDWGRQGDWGSFSNRANYRQEDEWREHPYREESRSDFGGARSGRSQLFGTGGGGFGTGFSSYGAGIGPYSGGLGAYGERGRHAGRGPKGWQRSDDRIREDVSERLTDHPDVDASEIEVQVQNGEVTLTGTVDERRAKRLAEDIAESVSGVRDVHNQIRVQWQVANRGESETSNRNKRQVGM